MPPGLGVARSGSGPRSPGCPAPQERVTGVTLADGTTISADLVVNAAGPWCNRLNELAGVDLRWTLTPTRVQTVYRSWPSELGRLPIGADVSTGIYFRPESGGQQVLVGSVLAEDEEEIVADPDDFKRVPDADFTEMKLAAFHHRIPGLEPRGEISGIAGLYTINREDVHPVVGPTGRDGFWVANGFSGHGFKLAPAIGSMVAQAVSGRAHGFRHRRPHGVLLRRSGADRRRRQERARLMRYLDGSAVRQALPMADAIVAMEHAFTGVTETPLRSVVGPSLVMPGTLDGVMAVKVVSIVPGNPVGLVVVFGEDGSPIGVVDGPTVTAIRTGAVAGLATKLLARPDAGTLAMLGAGAMAFDQVAAVQAVRPIERVLVWSRSPEKARALAERVGGEAVADVSAAVAEADVISCATPATTPLFEADLVRPGTHVNAVGAFTPEMAELAPRSPRPCLRRRRRHRRSSRGGRRPHPGGSGPRHDIARPPRRNCPSGRGGRHRLQERRHRRPGRRRRRPSPRHGRSARPRCRPDLTRADPSVCS